VAVFNSVVTVAALTLAYAVQGQLAYELKWKPKKGEAHVYELFIKDKDSSVEAAVEHKVTEVKSDGTYTVQSRSLGAIVRVAGSDIRDDRPNEARATFDPFGRLVELKGGTTGLAKYRSALLTKFVAPPLAGDLGMKWTYERERDRPTGLAACKIEYTLSSAKDGMAEVQFKFTELGGEFSQTATGTWWINTTNTNKWLPVRMEAKVKNFAGSESAETEIKLVLRRPE
jgi:hypothetical protein